MERKQKRVPFAWKGFSTMRSWNVFFAIQDKPNQVWRAFITCLLMIKVSEKREPIGPSERLSVTLP